MPTPAQTKANRAAGLPDWYESEADESARLAQAPAPAAPNPSAAIPDWLRQMDMQEAAKANSAAPQSANRPLPDWYLQMQEQERQQSAQAAPSGPLPDWYAPETVTSEAVKPDTTAHDVMANIATGVARVPGAIFGLPHMLGHTMNWGQAQLDNALNYFLNSKAPHETGADLDKIDPVMKVLPSSQDIDKQVFKGISGIAGKDVQPYEPESFFGKLGQAAVTGALGGFVDPLAIAGGVGRGASVGKAMLEGGATRAAKTAIAADAANATQQAFPDSPGVAAAAALIAHGGTSALEAGGARAGAVAADAARQVFRPARQGDIEAGRVLQRVDNTQPGLASPDASQLAAAGQAVKQATNDIGPGLPAHMAGAELRAGLQARQDAIRSARSQAGDVAYDAFREQPPLPASQLETLMRAPGFRKAIGAANAAALDEGDEPLTDYWDFDAAGDPVLKPNAAIPPDVLGRVKSWTAAAATNAPAGSAEARTAGILDKRVGDFLDAAYPPSAGFPGYAAVRDAYAQATKPLGDFAGGPVEKTLDADRQYGQRRYVMPDERLPDLFLKSKATRTDLNQLVAAHGGDKDAALSALQDHLAAVAQRAVQPDGTLDTAAFDKAMQPYQQSLGNLGVWFPQLAGKFSTAKAAQATLDNMREQRAVADAVAGGALRNKDGAVTGPSLDGWLRSNRDALARTQSPSAVMRLQSIASAIRDSRPGELADALKSEWAPTALGAATGGLEGGVLATLLHKSAQTAFGNMDAKRVAAFSAAIEQAVTDPAYAERLSASAAKGRSAGLSPKRAVIRAIAATPIAVSAGR